MKLYVKESSSLFARLHPSKVKALYEELKKENAKANVNNDVFSSISSSKDEQEDGSSCWCVDEKHEAKSGEEVDFLTLQINIRGHVFYVSYNGGKIRGEDGQNVIELHESLLFKNKNNKNLSATVAEVKALRKVKNAKKIEIEPMDASDWELLDCFSNYLENGGLLQQVSIVYPNQILALKLPSGDMVHALVKAFPESDSSSNDCPCLRLIQDSQVMIVPKSRPPEFHKPSIPFRVLPVLSDIDHDTTAQHQLYNNDDDQGDIQKICCAIETTPLPYSIHLHPQTIQSNIPGFDDQNGTNNSSTLLTALLWKTSTNLTTTNSPIDDNTDSSDLDSPVVLVKIVSSTDVPPNHVVMHPLVRIQIGVTPLYDDIQIQLLSKTQWNTSCCSLLLDPQQQQLQHLLSLTLEPVSFIHSKFILNPNTFPIESYRLANPSYQNNDTTPYNISEYFLSKSLERFLDDYLLCDNNDFPLTTQTLLSLTTNISSNNDKKEVLFLLSLIPNNINYNNNFNNNNNQTIMPITRSAKTPCDKPQRSCPLFINAKQLKHLLQLYSNNNHRNNSLLQITHNITIQQVLLPIYEPYFHLLPQVYPSLLLNDYERICIQHFQQENINSPCLLAYAEKGMGKTHFALTISYKLRYYYGISMIYLNCHHLQSSTTKMKDLLDQLTSMFLVSCNKKGDNTPSILILDDLDVLVPNLDNDNDSEQSSNKHKNIQYQSNNNPIVTNQVKLISDHIKNLMDEVRQQNITVYIIATCRNRQTLNKSLTSQTYFYHSIAIPTIPSSSIQRYQLFQKMIMHQYNTHFSKSDNESERNTKYLLENIINQHHFKSTFIKYSYAIKTLKDLSTLSKLVYDSLQQQHRQQSISNDEYFELFRKDNKNALHHIIKSFIKSSSSTSNTTTSSTTSNNNNEQPSSLKWDDDVGGLFQAKLALTEAIINPIKFKRVYDCSPVTLSKGILLFGPSGCGKSYLIPALAKKCNLSLITVHGPEMLDKYIGSSESKIRSIFNQAKVSSPSLLFFDNFDSLALQRGSDHTGVTDRIVNQLLTFLDGVEKNETTNDDTIVYVIAATSRPNVIDKALIRPGRLDQHIYIGFPTTIQEQKDIIRILSKDLIFDENVLQFIQSDDDNRMFQTIKHCQYYTPADWKAVFDTCYLNAIRDTVLTTTTASDIKNNDEKNKNNNLLSLSDEIVKERFTRNIKQHNSVIIQMNHLLQAFKETKPSISGKDRFDLERYYDSFIGRCSGKETTSEEKHKFQNDVDSKVALM